MLNIRLISAYFTRIILKNVMKAVCYLIVESMMTYFYYAPEIINI